MKLVNDKNELTNEAKAMLDTVLQDAMHDAAIAMGKEKMDEGITMKIVERYLGKRFVRRKDGCPKGHWTEYEFECVQVITMYWEEGSPLALVARIDDDECFPVSQCTEIK